MGNILPTIDEILSAKKKGLQDQQKDGPQGFTLWMISSITQHSFIP
jgi:hypothetical protein